MSRKLAIAITQSDEHGKAFQELSSVMQEDNICSWTAQVVAWEQDKSGPNPYRLERDSGESAE